MKPSGVTTETMLSRTSGPGLGEPASPKEAAQEFEAMFWRILLKNMTKALPAGSLTKGPYGNMIERELSLALAESGSLGIADRVLQQLQERGANEDTKLAMPVAGRITSKFGFRLDPFTNKRAFHAGLDIAAPVGTPVKASAGGTVIFTGNLNGYGNVVIIQDEFGRKELYAHLHDMLVAKGQQVARGSVVATVGDTGKSTGPHLHFEVRTPKGPVDPFDAGLEMASFR